MRSAITNMLILIVIGTGIFSFLMWRHTTAASIGFVRVNHVAYAEDAAEPTATPEPAISDSSKDELLKLKAQNEELAEKLKAITADRENILQQVKIAYQERDKVYDMATKAYQERDEAVQVLEDLPKEVEEAKAEKEALEKKIQDLEVSRTNLDAENKSMADLVENLKLEIKKAEDSLQRDEQNAKILLAIDEIKELKSKLALSETRKKDLEKEKADALSQMDKVNQKMANYESVMAENARLKGQLVEIPANLAKVTKEKEQTVKESAYMHYNMGVFFAKNRQYAQAVKEFEKSIELKPDDALSHYNLGLLYSDSVKNDEKALLHFERYVELSPDATDANWVRKAIGTLRAFKN